MTGMKLLISLVIMALFCIPLACVQVATPAEKVREFIRLDKTYALKLYNCAYYASESMVQAKEKGLEPYVVILYFDLTETANLYSSHVILAFDTTEGRIFYDPQRGREVEVAVGLEYWFWSGEYIIKQYIVIGGRDD